MSKWQEARYIGALKDKPTAGTTHVETRLKKQYMYQVRRITPSSESVTSHTTEKALAMSKIISF